jgi:hypothetical protein
LLFVRVELDVANNQSPPDNKTGLGELAMATASTPAHSTGAVGQTATSDVIANVWALTWVKSTQKIAAATPIRNFTSGLTCQTNRSIAPRILEARVDCKFTTLGFDGRNGSGQVDPLLGREEETVPARLISKSLEFEGIKTGVVDAFPDAEEQDGVLVLEPLLNQRACSIKVPHHVGERNIVAARLREDCDGRVKGSVLDIGYSPPSFRRRY